MVLGRVLEEILLTQLTQRRHEVGRGGEPIEPLGELGAVALADAGDQRLLAVEIDVERAGADARLLADVVHGGAVEAGAGKARARAASRMCSRRAVCTSGLSFGIAVPTYRLLAPHRLALAPAPHKTKRTTVLFATKPAKSRRRGGIGSRRDHKRVRKMARLPAPDKSATHCSILPRRGGRPLISSPMSEPRPGRHRCAVAGSAGCEAEPVRIAPTVQRTPASCGCH